LVDYIETETQIPSLSKSLHDSQSFIYFILFYRGVATLIRKVLISLALQPRDHFIHQLGTLREEFICAVSGRPTNLKIKFLEQAEQRYLVREDEIRAAEQNSEKEHSMRTFIPPSMTDLPFSCHITTETNRIETNVSRRVSLSVPS
jgi:hypothetical protein